MTTLRELQAEVARQKAARGWPDLAPEQRFVYLVSEVGELADALRQLDPGATPDAIAEARSQAGYEMYDIVWNLCDLANTLSIDLEAAFAAKDAYNRGRWPG